ncbi:MAG: hypothetical protein A3F84_27510 [Candidatus Handelsmanbacteria bacterium RIFCSPLOWO2_12_FULL_64_10]|uniref:Uncharacterized protein n=1 Tax=Handelsmanbacteria sp. (strain RIFCSPLOWO2_12_FULL_64_10) TaxID=1817868 RepID=A0A1F6C4T0_HANXR|nr:MAG: hypothetical protein A3F84_27510 [Candidatus Handelsmanbacteria bacterium RIFCSPLOWO2_12_FULL_64_10]
MGLGVAEVEGVDHHADVGGVLARLAHVRDLDQLEAGLVHGRLELLVALPVAVGLANDDAALEQQPFQHPPDVELRILRLAHAERDVLEVAEERHVFDLGLAGHGNSPGRGVKTAPLVILPSLFPLSHWGRGSGGGV